MWPLCVSSKPEARFTLISMLSKAGRDLTTTGQYSQTRGCCVLIPLGKLHKLTKQNIKTDLLCSLVSSEREIERA